MSRELGKMRRKLATNTFSALHCFDGPDSILPASLRDVWHDVALFWSQQSHGGRAKA